MKKFILFFATLFISVILFAQGNSEHLTFKGVPIDGALSEYVTKMKNAGFKYLGEQDGIVVLQCDFEGFKSCTVGNLSPNNYPMTLYFPPCKNGEKTWSQCHRMGFTVLNYFSIMGNNRFACVR